MSSGFSAAFLPLGFLIFTIFPCISCSGMASSSSSFLGCSFSFSFSPGSLTVSANNTAFICGFMGRRFTENRFLEDMRSNTDCLSNLPFNLLTIDTATETSSNSFICNSFSPSFFSPSFSSPSDSTSFSPGPPTITRIPDCCFIFGDGFTCKSTKDNSFGNDIMIPNILYYNI